VIILTDLYFLHNNYQLSWKAATIDSLISNDLLILLSLLMMNTLRFYLPRGSQYINIVIWGVIMIIGWSFLRHWLLGMLLKDDPFYMSFLVSSLHIRGIIGFLLLGCVSLITILWLLFEEQKSSERRKQDAEKLTKEAELFKLRQQLQPHFLFNSLNSINALIGSRPDEARKMVQQLSDFLRGTIRKEDKQWVTLREEMQYLQLYLDIEKVRFGNRLRTEINVSEQAFEMKIPALLLQPVMENAIKYGLYDTTGETVIKLNAYTEDVKLVVQIENPFDPETSAPKTGTGFGLQSVQRRLALLFARHDLLVTKAEGHTFITGIKIPQTLNHA
jgi:two-component system LytT family sensor kinase